MKNTVDDCTSLQYELDIAVRENHRLRADLIDLQIATRSDRTLNAIRTVLLVALGCVIGYVLGALLI